MDGRNDEGCPRWCTGEHDELVAVAERLHRSAASSVPVVLWAGQDGAAGATVHVSLCRPGESGEDRLRLEADGLGEVDLDLSSGSRLAGAVLRLLGAS